MTKRSHIFLLRALAAVTFLVMCSEPVLSQGNSDQAAAPPPASPWAIFIGNEARPVPACPVIIEAGKLFMSLDLVRILGGQLSYDSTTKTVSANLSGKQLLLNVKKRSARFDGEPLPTEYIVQTGNKWYFAADVWAVWGYRARWHPNFHAWQLVGKVTRTAYNKETSDLVFETALPVQVVSQKDYASRQVVFRIEGAFVDKETEIDLGDAGTADIAESEGVDGDTVLIRVTQSTFTGFRVFAEDDRKFHRINFRNHFQLADYEKSSSGEIRIKVAFGKPTDLTVKELTDPPRVVLDFSDSIYVDATSKIDVGIGHVSRIRIGQFSQPPDPYIARVVVDLTERIPYRVVSTEEKDVYYIQFLGKPTGKYAIMVDAGHGGSDPGALSSFTDTQEKEINLDIAHGLQKYLENNGQTVYTTRNGDYFVTLEDRADLTNTLLPMFFVSIHSNSISTPDIKGVMTFYFEGSVEGKRLAEMIQQRVVAECDVVDKGVRTANYFVLRETVVPAVLVECGFVTNEEEEKLLRDPAYRKKLAQAIGDGILDYCAAITAEAVKGGA